MQGAAERWKPEAMYFAAPDGRRTALMVFDMADPSDLVPFCEPFFQELDADVEIIPVMAPDGFAVGIRQARQTSQYPSTVTGTTQARSWPYYSVPRIRHAATPSWPGIDADRPHRAAPQNFSQMTQARAEAAGQT